MPKKNKPTPSPSARADGSPADDSGDNYDHPESTEAIRRLRLQQEEHGNCIQQLSKDMEETQSKLDDILVLLRQSWPSSAPASDGPTSPPQVQFDLDDDMVERPLFDRQGPLSKLLKDKHPEFQVISHDL